MKQVKTLPITFARKIILMKIERKILIEVKRSYTGHFRSDITAKVK